MGNQMRRLDCLPDPSDQRPDESLEFNHCQHLSVSAPPQLHRYIFSLLVFGIIYICISLVAHGMVLLLRMA